MNSKCYMINNGTNDADLSVFTKDRGNGMHLTVPVIGVLVKHPLANILFDSGIQDTNCLPAKLHKYAVTREQTLQAQFDALGLMFDDVDFIVNSHLHWDHCGNNSLFKKARTIVRPEEMEFARIEAMGGDNPYYRLRDIDHPDIQYVSLPRGGSDFKLFEGIDILFTPGHTAGSQSLLVDTERGKVLFASDAVYILQYNYIEEILPGICFSEEAQKNTIKKIKALGDITVIPGHDPYLKLEEIYG